MGVIGDTVLELVAETVAIGVVFALVAATATLLALPAPPLRRRLGIALGAAALGAMVAAAAADRLGAPEVWLLAVGRRSVPLLWSAIGAFLGIAVGVTVWPRPSRRTAGEE